MKKSTTFWNSGIRAVKPLALVLLCLAGLASCKKDSDEAVAPASPTKTQLLTSKAWTLTASTISPAMMGMTDMYSMMSACQTDNTLKFNADATKTLVQDEGTTKCSSMDPQTVTGSWLFNSNETAVTTTLSGQTDTYSLNSLSASSLNVSYTMVYSGVTYTITNTYSNQ